MIGSAQDGFSPRDSCLAQIPAAALTDSSLGPIYIEAARAFYGFGGNRTVEAGIARRFEKLDVRFLALENARLSVDGVIGRDAHVAHLESEAFAAALAVTLRELFE